MSLGLVLEAREAGTVTGKMRENGQVYLPISLDDGLSGELPEDGVHNI